MTKKDYELLAATIREAHAAAPSDGTCGYDAGVRYGMRELARRLSDALAARAAASKLAGVREQRFDRERFLKACGL